MLKRYIKFVYFRFICEGRVIRSLINMTLISVAIAGSTAVFAQDQSGGDVAEKMDLARRMVQQGKLDEALPVFEEVIRIDGQNAEAYYHAGNIYLRRKLAGKGLGYLERSVQLAPENARLRLVLAQAYENFGQGDKAIAEYRKIIDDYPQGDEVKEADRRLKILIGRKYGETGDFAKALSLFSEVLAKHPDDVPTLIDLGLTYLFMNNLADAQVTFEKALALDPDNSLIHKDLGEVFEKKGDKARSAAHYEKALQLLPPGSTFIPQIEAKLALYRGERYLANGELVDAGREYEKVLAKDPRNPAALFNLAAIYRELGKIGDAERMLRTLSEDKPDDQTVKLRLGTLLLERGNVREAKEMLESVVSQEEGGPLTQQARRLLSDIMAREAGKTPDAASLESLITDYRSLVEKNRDNRNAWLDLGNLYLKMRKTAEAIEPFENVIRIDPNDAQALAILGGLYEKTDRFADALDTLDRYLSLEKDIPKQRGVASRMALILARKAFREERMDEAKREFKEIIAEDNKNYIAHFFMAVILAREGNLEDAAAEYQEVLTIVPGHAPARLNLAMLYEQIGKEEQALAEYRSVTIANVPEISDNARSRLEALSRRIGGFSYSMGYTMAFDSNSNLSPTNPVQETRSDMSGSAQYQRKIGGKRLYWGLKFSPVYSVYHQQQFDFLQMEASPYISGVWNDYNLLANYSISQVDGVQVEQHYNQSNSIYLEASRRVKIPPLLPFLASDIRQGWVPSAWRISGTYRSFRTETAPYADANTYSIGLLINQSGSNGWSWTGIYNYTNNQNATEIGNDFAYQGHSLGLQLAKSLSPRMTVNGAINGSYNFYKNPDSVTTFTKRRVNKASAFSLGTNYSLKDNLRIFMNVNYQRNNSNLPTGFILSTADVGTAVGIQSPSLGDYRKYGITAGFSLSF